MSGKVIDLQQYKKAKDGFRKLLNNNPQTILTFKEYFKVKTFLEKVQKAKLKVRDKK